MMDDDDGFEECVHCGGMFDSSDLNGEELCADCHEEIYSSEGDAA